MSACNARSRVCALSIAVLLSACGGGGDGEGSLTPPPQRGGGGSTTPPPPGSATAAILDRGTTRDIAATAIAELDLTAEPAEHPYLPEIVSRGKAVVANVEDPCPGGGGIEETQNLDDDLTGTIGIVFNDCVQDGVRQNGALNIRIDEFDAASNAAIRFVLEFEDLTFTVDQFSAVANGTVAVERDGPVETTTWSITGRYSPDELSSRLENVVITETSETSGARRMTIAGRLFHSRHGYVDISTLEELAFPNADEPASGVIRLTGAQNAAADISFDGRRVRVSLDTDADGRVDAGLAATWLELRDTRNFAPAANAGADITIEHGASVTADASSSADWEGDPLTYEWTLTRRPDGSTAAVSATSPSVSFKPDVPGEYELEVTVRDASGGSSDTVLIEVLPAGALPPNLRPRADAGLDQLTVEGQSVTIDGSATRDPENDPLAFAWQLVRAPGGSAVTVNATSATFDFTPDLPGTYELRLTADDGRSTDSDTMRVVADRLLTFVSGADFRIRGTSLRGDDTAELRLRTSPRHRGPPVAVSVSSEAVWLRVTTPEVASAPPGDTTSVRIELNLEEVKKLKNGSYETQVRAVPAGGQRVAIAEVSLSLKVPRGDKVVPYVAYAGNPSLVTLYGEELAEADGSSLFINGIEVLGIAASSDDHATVHLPPLPVGTYTVRIGDALGLSPEFGRVLVRDAPVYADEHLSLPGAVLSLEYDAERDSFYGVYLTSAGTALAGWLHRPGGTWQLDPIGVPAPAAVGLTADGTQLFVSSENCTVYRLDPATLAVLQALTKASCDPVVERFGAIAALADGRVLIIDDELNSNVYEYPGFTPTQVLPAMQYPVAVLNYDRNRLLWAESALNPEPRSVYFYDVWANAQRANLHGSTHFSGSRLGMSGDGSRTLHQARVYDEALRFIGTLDGRDAEEVMMPALDREGRRAVALDLQSNALFVHDVSGPGPSFPQIGGGIVLHSNVTAGSRVVVPPTGSAAFVFTVNQWIPGFDPDPFKLYVRLLP